MPEKKQEFSAVIDRLEENKAVLKFPDSQTLIVPIEFLPEGAGEGGVIKLSFGENSRQEEERGNLAKKMLNEILKRDKS